MTLEQSYVIKVTIYLFLKRQGLSQQNKMN